MATNERALLALGALLYGAGGGKRWVSSLHGKLREAQSREPLNATLSTVLAGAAVFYAAERGKNPKVKTFQDALVYVSTCISVGYSDIFAQTPLGKLVGSTLMTYGPALATRAFDPPSATPPPSDPALAEVVQKLDAILVELRARGA